MAAATREQSTTGARGENLAGALAYLTFVPAVCFMFLEPYKSNRFVRFHSSQCILFWIAGVLAAISLKLVGMLLFMIPIVGPLLVTVIDVLAGLAAIFLWVVLVVKALQGEMFRLPWLGDFADQSAGRVQPRPEN